jgi:hypothetical protein
VVACEQNTVALSNLDQHMFNQRLLNGDECHIHVHLVSWSKYRSASGKVANSVFLVVEFCEAPWSQI